MKIVISDEKKMNIFTCIFKHLKVFGTNFNLTFNKSRLYIQGMDAARISLFELILIHSWFDEYEIETSVTVGLNIEILFKILNMRRDDQIIHIHLDENGDTFDIKLVGKINQNFNIPIMDIEIDLLAVPNNTEWCADLVIQSKLLADLMNQQSLFGDAVKIKCTEKEVIISSNDMMVGKMATQIQFDDLIEYCVEENGCIEISYSLRYVIYMTCFAEIAKIVTMNISKDIPMRLHYSLDHQKEDEEENEADTKNFMNFYLAPKIEDDY